MPQRLLTDFMSLGIFFTYSSPARPLPPLLTSATYRATHTISASLNSRLRLSRALVIGKCVSPLFVFGGGGARGCSRPLLKTVRLMKGEATAQQYPLTRCSRRWRVTYPGLPSCEIALKGRLVNCVVSSPGSGGTMEYRDIPAEAFPAYSAIIISTDKQHFFRQDLQASGPAYLPIQAQDSNNGGGTSPRFLHQREQTVPQGLLSQV